MGIKSSVAALAWAALLMVTVVTTTGADERAVVGYIEKVLLSPGKVQAYALMNTSTGESSVFSPVIEEFEREGRKWVRYTIETRFGQRTTFESPVVKARLQGAGQNATRRLTVHLQICLGESPLEGDFELIKSDEYSEQLVLGREFLGKHVLVDPAESYKLNPSCS